ncbi:hypothetical protein EJ05DRAFT_323033 [Pseudovirgaria hyperparasitica]|uniref:Uncharacterized protein n=1 Tax=Pseudovirgaria hyperparasitica TaxID=470096 RepID=A0A6A6VQH6_9PEZI|nr:uncharacterized protein EJ05DRAFT_323033 [Pseudovirgaria hyperparasitica]KAF2752453.1 hypothetical protein EJ05DRAFT_323033 [Pseudovirgaria hyperparasitica]
MPTARRSGKRARFSRPLEIPNCSTEAPSPPPPPPTRLNRQPTARATAGRTQTVRKRKSKSKIASGTPAVDVEQPTTIPDHDANAAEILVSMPQASNEAIDIPSSPSPLRGNRCNTPVVVGNTGNEPPPSSPPAAIALFMLYPVLLLRVNGKKEKQKNLSACLRESWALDKVEDVVNECIQEVVADESWDFDGKTYLVI